MLGKKVVYNGLSLQVYTLFDFQLKTSVHLSLFFDHQKYFKNNLNQTHQVSQIYLALVLILILLLMLQVFCLSQRIIYKVRNIRFFD